MAENEQDEPIKDKDDDLLTDEAEGESEEKKKRFSKPLLIKIGIGVTVLLLIAGGAYFFLMSDEEPVDEALTTELTDTEGESDTVAGIDDPVDAINSEEAPIAGDNATVIESVKEEGGGNAVPEEGADASSSPAELTNAQELAQIRDDIKALQEENSRLKSQVTGEEVPSDVEEKPSGEDDVKVDEPSKVKAVRNQYSDIYQEESREYPYVRKPKQESVPQPKWGE